MVDPPRHILVTKKDCQKCDWLKKKIPPNNGIDFIDAETPEGMALLAYHEIFNEDTQIPLLITADEQIIENALPIKNFLQAGGHLDESIHQGEAQAISTTG